MRQQNGNAPIAVSRKNESVGAENVKVQE